MPVREHMQQVARYEESRQYKEHIDTEKAADQVEIEMKQQHGEHSQTAKTIEMFNIICTKGLPKRTRNASPCFGWSTIGPDGKYIVAHHPLGFIFPIPACSRHPLGFASHVITAWDPSVLRTPTYDPHSYTKTAHLDEFIPQQLRWVCYSAARVAQSRLLGKMKVLEVKKSITRKEDKVC